MELTVDDSLIRDHMIRRHVQKSQASIPTGLGHSQARGAMSTPPNRRRIPLRLVVSAQSQGEEGQGDGVEGDGQENMQGRCFRS